MRLLPPPQQWLRTTLVLLLCLAVFTAVVVSGALDEADRDVLDFLDSIGGRRLDVVSALFALTASVAASGVWLAAALLLGWLRPVLRSVLWTGVGVLVAVSVLELLMKVTIDHPGPNATLTPGALVGGPFIPTRGSYPSGHMARAVVMAACTVVALPQRWRTPLAIAATFWCIVIFWTRVYLRDHWLSDAIGGVVLGCATIPPLQAWAAQDAAAVDRSMVRSVPDPRTP